MCTGPGHTLLSRRPLPISERKKSGSLRLDRPSLCGLLPRCFPLLCVASHTRTLLHSHAHAQLQNQLSEARTRAAASEAELDKTREAKGKADVGAQELSAQLEALKDSFDSEKAALKDECERAHVEEVRATTPVFVSSPQLHPTIH